MRQPLENKQHRTIITEKREANHGSLEQKNLLPRGSFQATDQEVETLTEPKVLTEFRNQRQHVRRQRWLEFGGQRTTEVGAKQRELQRSAGGST